MIRIHLAGPEDLDFVRGHVAGWAKRSLGRLYAEDVLEDMTTGCCQIWVIRKNNEPVACFRTERCYPNFLLTHLSGVGREDWIEAYDDFVMHQARDAGCVRIIGLCRVGWWKEARRLGWRQTHVEIVKEVC